METLTEVPACHMHIPICIKIFQGLFFFHLFIPTLPHLLTICMIYLVLHPIQNQFPNPPCPFHLFHNKNLIHKVKCMLRRAHPIPIMSKKGKMGKVTRTSNLKVIKVAKVHNLMHLSDTNPIPQPSKMVANPRKTRVIVQTNLLPVVVYTTMILMSVHFFLKSIKHGKLKKLLL